MRAWPSVGSATESTAPYPATGGTNPDGSDAPRDLDRDRGAAVDLQGGERVLDVACGNGNTALAQEMDVSHGDGIVLPLAYLEVVAHRR